MAGTSRSRGSRRGIVDDALLADAQALIHEGPLRGRAREAGPAVPCSLLPLQARATTGVEEATGLDAPMIRRCLVACLERVVPDAAFARDGEERLNLMRDLGPVTLPEIRAGAVDERTLRDRRGARGP